MSIDNLVSRASIYLGLQESLGSNDGPNIRRWKAMMGAGVVAAHGIPWCGVFVFCMLLERNNIEKRSALVAALGFRPASFFPESTSSWVQEANFCAGSSSPLCSWVDAPRAGDVMLLMKLKPDGSHSTTEAEHIGIFRGMVDTNLAAPTIEGNTVPQGSSGNSREGIGVYERVRSLSPSGRIRILRLPSLLTGFEEVAS